MFNPTLRFSANVKKFESLTPINKNRVFDFVTKAPPRPTKSQMQAQALGQGLASCSVMHHCAVFTVACSESLA